MMWQKYVDESWLVAIIKHMCSEYRFVKCQGLLNYQWPLQSTNSALLGKGICTVNSVRAAFIVKLRVAHAPGMPGTFSPPPTSRKPGMHHGTCITHVPWTMSGSLTRGGRENVPGIPATCATRNFTYLARGRLHCLHFSVLIRLPW